MPRARSRRARFGPNGWEHRVGCVMERKRSAVTSDDPAFFVGSRVHFAIICAWRTGRFDAPRPHFLPGLHLGSCQSLAEGATMGDITDKRLLYLKGGLFLVGGILASALILVECPSFQVALLLAVAVWCFARAYYFAFYVIEHYVDPSYRFSGLWSFAWYALQKQRSRAEIAPPPMPATPHAERASGESRPNA